MAKPAENQDRQQAAAFLRLITSQWYTLREKAHIELRALFPGKQPQIARFAPDDTGIDLAVDFACMFSAQGYNIYPVINPVRASAPLRRDGKQTGATDDDIICSFFCWADGDDEAAVYAIKNFAGPKYSFAVTTGKTPFPRPHIYWALEEPIYNLTTWTQIQRGIAAQLSTDKTVVNPSRIMRLPGMINWPTEKKVAKGYVAELATLRTEYEDERAPVSAERMWRIFGEAGERAAQPAGTGFQIDTGHHSKTVEDFNDILRRARTDGEKHRGVRDLAASLAGQGVNRSLTEAIIRNACPVWDAGVEKLISSAYDQFYQEKAQERHFDPPPDDATAEWPTPVTNFDEASLPRRQWVYGTDYIRGYVSVIASAGGIGKTSNGIVEALAIVTGRPLLGVEVKEQTRVWIVNLEDPRVELEMRVLAAMKHYGIKPDEVRGKLFLDGEDTIQITLAAEGRDGLVKNDPLLANMVERVKRNGIGVVMMDPFVSTHMVNENSNASVQAVVAMFRDMARQTSAAMSLLHHVRKGNGEDAGVDSVRGAGSLIGAARAVRIFNRISEADAERLGVPPGQAKGIFRIDDGKANLAPPAEKALYRQMLGVKIDNGEWIGVAVPFELPDEWAGMSDDVVNAMLRKIEEGPDGDGQERYSARPQDKARWAGTVITSWPFKKSDDNKSEAQAKLIIRQWLKSGMLEEVDYYSAAQRKDRKGLARCGRAGPQE